MAVNNVRKSLTGWLFGVAVMVAHGADPSVTIKVNEPALPASAKQELRSRETINAIRSRRHTNVVYSGAAIQAAKSNPLQLINPFAPARYGNGTANTVTNPFTGRAEGIKIIAVSR